VTEVKPWQPAFPGQRPPFPLGHTLSLKHGGYSARVTGERAQQVLARLEAVGDLAWLQAQDGPAVEAWCRAQARAELLHEALDAAEVTSKGLPRFLFDQWAASERLASRLADRLGLAPLARAQLARDTTMAQAAAAQGLAQTLQAGRDARESRHTDTDTDTDGGAAT